MEFTNNTERYILSIIIPTRNRQLYAFACMMQILESTDDDVQLVIQDNSDTNLLIDKFIDSPYLSRIKYNHSSELLSFVANFSEGVAQADGEYLCMIGDDDGINPEITKLVYWAKENNVEAITPEIRLNYIWPDTGISYYKNDTGNLMIVNFNLSAKIYETKTEINKLLESGGQNYLKYNLVKIYHGIVKKSAMDRVKSITGNYFGGLSPDIYSSVALSLVIDKVLKIDYPLTIPGVCSKSGAGHSSTGRHHGNLEDAPQLKGHINYQWSSLVPRFYCVETLWADSALAAFKEMGRLDLLDKFNVPRLSAYCYLRYKSFSSFTDDNFKNYRINKKIGKIQSFILLYKSFVLGPIYELAIRISAKIFRPRNQVERFENIPNIKIAETKLKEYLRNRKTNINILIKDILNF